MLRLHLVSKRRFAGKQTTALVHEAWMRLACDEGVEV